MEEPYICETCNKKSFKYKHTLSSALVESLRTVYRFGGVNKPIVISDCLDHNRICNFQKLKYWGLVAPFVIEENKVKRGEWVVTDLGKRFLVGSLGLPSFVWTLNGVPTKDKSETLVLSADVLKKGKDKKKKFQHRGEWVEEREGPQLKIDDFNV